MLGSHTALYAAIALADPNVLNVQAGFIYNFTKFIKWESAEENKEFLISVYSDEGLFPILEKELAGKKVGSAPIKVVNQEKADVQANARMVIVDSSNAANVEKVVANANKVNAVTVSRYDNMIESGICINFYLSENKVRFEINKTCTENRDYKISSQLLKLAKIK